MAGPVRRCSVNAHLNRRAGGLSHPVKPVIAVAGRPQQDNRSVPGQIAQQSQHFPHRLLAGLGWTDQEDLVQVGYDGGPEDIAKVTSQIKTHPSPSTITPTTMKSKIPLSNRFHLLRQGAAQQRRPRGRGGNKDTVRHLDRQEPFVSSRHSRCRSSPAAVPRGLRIVPVEIQQDPLPMNLLCLCDQPAEGGFTEYRAVEGGKCPCGPDWRRRPTIAVNPCVQLGLVEIAYPHLYRYRHRGPGGGVLVRYPQHAFPVAHRRQEGLWIGQPRQVASHQNGLGNIQSADESFPVRHHLDPLLTCALAHIGVYPAVPAGHHYPH